MEDDSPQSDFFDNLFDTANSESRPSRLDEMDQYLNSTVNDDNILTYWQNKEEIWPKLSQCAKWVLSFRLLARHLNVSSHWRGEPSMIDEARRSHIPLMDCYCSTYCV